jgi:uncharacterized protein (TIGR03435 family)
MAIAVAFAQPSARPQFDAASIKPNPSPSLRSVLMPPKGGLLSTRSASLRLLIQNAYGVQAFQILGGPDWMRTIGFDVEAKAEGNPTNVEVWLMLQSLLEERFALKVHRETRELPVYLLTATKSGLKMSEPKPGDCTDLGAVGQYPMTGPCGGLTLGADQSGLFMRGRQVAIPELAKNLSAILGRTIIDQTGKPDKFDVSLEFAYDEVTVGVPRAPAPDPPVRPSILDALDQQLGLKLTSSKGAVEVLVIDHTERPTAN